MNHTHYTITDNRTGETWAEAFTAQDARYMGAPELGSGMSAEHAQSFVRSMNRAQANHLSEFEYGVMY